MVSTNGYTAAEIAEQLNCTVDRIRGRILRMRIDPIRRVGPTALYSDAALEQIRQSVKRIDTTGRAPSRRRRRRLAMA